MLRRNADKLNRLGQLPDSCVASADCLERQRKVYEAYGVFSTAMIDGIIKQLRDFNDSNLRKEVENRPEELKSLLNATSIVGKVYEEKLIIP